jgi:ribosomal protein S18 acetylase RimI-like enzyme
MSIFVKYRFYHFKATFFMSKKNSIGGGMTGGKPHSQGGTKFSVNGTGVIVELEKDEPVIANEAVEDNTVRTYVGTNIEILNKINTSAGGKSMKEPVTDISGGDLVVCVRSAADKKVRKITGTPKQVVSAINESGGCRKIEDGATVQNKFCGGGKIGGCGGNCGDCPCKKGFLSPNINIENNGRSGLAKLSDVLKFVGEDRLGDAKMTTSRDRIEHLKTDILNNGFKEPVVIIYDKGKGEASLIEGNHRIAAAKELGLNEIPVRTERGVLRTNEQRVNEGMFPLSRVNVGFLNDTYGVKAIDLGISIRNMESFDIKTECSCQKNKFESGGEIKDFINPEAFETYTDEAELVPVSELVKFAEFDRLGKDELSFSRENIIKLKKDIRENGFKYPLIIEYYQGEKKALLIEGNHRIAVALFIGAKELPVRVVRSTRTAPKKAVSVTGIEPNEYGYVRGDLAPSEIGITARKFRFESGGEVEKIESNKQILSGLFPEVSNLEFLGKGQLGQAFIGTIGNDIVVAKLTKSLPEFLLTKMAMVSSPPNVVNFRSAKVVDKENYTYAILHDYVTRDAMPSEKAWELAGSLFNGIKSENWIKTQLKSSEEVFEYNQAKELIKSVEEHFGVELDTLHQNWGYDDSGRLVLYDLDGNMTVKRYKDFMEKHGYSHEYEEGGEIVSKTDSLYYFINGKKVGELNYSIENDGSFSVLPFKPKGELYIDMVEVDSDYRNKGIAKKLVLKAIELAKSENLDIVTLKRDSGLGCNYGSEYDNYLKGIYSSMGFVETWTLQDELENDERSSCSMHLFTHDAKFESGGEIKLYNGSKGQVIAVNKKYKNVFIIEKDEPNYLREQAEKGEPIAKFILKNYEGELYGYSGLYVYNTLKDKYDAVKILNNHFNPRKEIEYHDLKEDRYYTDNYNLSRVYSLKLQKTAIDSWETVLKKSGQKFEKYEMGGIFHGSPHRFDKFSTEYMGTGEGVQAFGWGLYFTDLEDIAKNYAKKLQKWTVGGKPYEEFIMDLDSESFEYIKEWYKQDDFSPIEIKEALEYWANKENKKTAKKALKYFEGKEIKKSSSKNLYRVSLHKGKTPDQYSWLEWDSPLNTSKIKDKIINMLIEVKVDKNNPIGELRQRKIIEDINNSAVGEYFYNTVIPAIINAKTQKEVSIFLLENGIDGVKFPAESIARGFTSDNARGFNYVVFDENAVSIDGIDEFKDGGEVFRFFNTEFNIDKAYSMINSGRFMYDIKNIPVYEQKHRGVNKDYSASLNPNFESAQGLMIKMENGNDLLIDGSHRMNNAFMKGVKEMKVFYIDNPKTIAKFSKTNKFKAGGEVRKDRMDNYIGDGTYHSTYNVIDFQNPNISATVSKSQTTESVYVNYYNSENQKSITVRFSNHINNAVKFGDQLDEFASKDEIAYRLGLKQRVFVQKTSKYIETRQVSNKSISQFQEADITIQELYSLDFNTDISEYKGKLAKGSNYLILGDKVNEYKEVSRNAFGVPVPIGTYTYKDIESFSQGGKIKLPETKIAFKTELPLHHLNFKEFSEYIKNK